MPMPQNPILIIKAPKDSGLAGIEGPVQGSRRFHKGSIVGVWA